MITPKLLLSQILLLAASTSAFAPSHRPPPQSSRTALTVYRSPITMPTTEPLVPYTAPGATHASFIGLKSAQLRSGKLWISQFIDDEASNSIISSLLYIRSEQEKDTIQLYLNVPGAVLRPALAIYDAISELKADGVTVETTNVALCAGMGALISAAGTKGKRRCMPNARYLLQKTGMDGVFQGQASDIALEVKSIKNWNEQIVREFARVSGQSEERLNQDLKRDFYLSSDEAVRYGLIDEVMMPSFGKRQRARNDDMLDIGVFSSGQKYQGGNDGKNQKNQPQSPRRPNGDGGGPTAA